MRFRNLALLQVARERGEALFFVGVEKLLLAR
jgi:hypothetical protein